MHLCAVQKSSITGKGHSNTEENYKTGMDILKQEIWSFSRNFFSAIRLIEIHFVPGCPGREKFVPGFLILPLSRNKRTIHNRK